MRDVCASTLSIYQKQKFHVSLNHSAVIARKDFNVRSFVCLGREGRKRKTFITEKETSFSGKIPSKVTSVTLSVVVLKAS